MARMVKEAAEKGGVNWQSLISQGVDGQQGTVFYVSQLQSSLGGFDDVPTLAKVLGEDAFREFQKAASDAIQSTESTINRFVPELSNPPDEFVSVAPDFWRPKATPKPPASSSKPKQP